MLTDFTCIHYYKYKDWQRPNYLVSTKSQTECLHCHLCCPAPLFCEPDLASLHSSLYWGYTCTGKRTKNHIYSNNLYSLDLLSTRLFPFCFCYNPFCSCYFAVYGTHNELLWFATKPSSFSCASLHSRRVRNFWKRYTRT